MSVEGGEEVSMNPMEKLRVRMASEGYQSMEGKNGSNNNIQNTEKHSLVESEKHQEGRSSGFSILEQVMAVFLVIFLVIIVALTVLVVMRHFNCDETSKCHSATCVEISGSLMKNMDLSAAPCEDFYQYACGRFNDDPLIPPSAKKYSWFSFMSTRALALSKKVLDEKGYVYQGRNSSAIEKVKTFYDVCLNVSATEDMGTRPLLQWIGELGSWTATNDEYSGTWQESSFHLETSLAHVYLQAITPFFLMVVSPDEKNNSINRVTFDQYGLSLADYTNYLGNASYIYHHVYSQYLVDVVTVLGGNRTQAEEIAEDLWTFETGMAKIMDTPDERQDAEKLYNKMTVHDFQQLINPLGDVFNLAEFLAAVFKEQVPADEEIVVRSPNYFSKLSTLIRDTETKTLANYIVWRSVQQVMIVQPRVLQVAASRAKSVLEGTMGEDPMWLQCVQLTASAMSEALGALYVNRYFDREDKMEVERLLDTIVAQFKARLPKNPWMDEGTMKKALEKVDAISYKLGYPSFILDAQQLDEYYERLTVNKTNAFDNFRNALHFTAVRAFEKRGKPPDPNQWSMGATQCNAYYSTLHNEMVFPAAILDKPFFSRSYPMAMNFGSMGFIMGHELTHGFDNRGSKFDKHGNLINWWSESSARHFQEKTQCLVDQYSQYTVADSYLNGFTTLGENIADNGGMRTSYKAYQAWMKTNGYSENSARLPGLNTTENQLFFLSFAQTWCAYYTPQYAQQSLVTDVHSYAKYRVIGTLSNSPEFAKAYSCPKGSPMNPEHKCTVW